MKVYCSCRITGAVLIQKLLDWFIATLLVSSLFRVSSSDAPHVEFIQMFTLTVISCNKAFLRCLGVLDWLRMLFEVAETIIN